MQYDESQRFLIALIPAMAFVWCGSKVAPARDIETAAVLLVIWTLLTAGLLLRTLTSDLPQMFFRASARAFLATLVGGALGLGLVVARTRKPR